MPQTLRKNFSNRYRFHLKPSERKGGDAPLSLHGFMLQLQKFIDHTKSDLMQPRQATIDNILLEAGRL
jgi:hypothetical protein